jgi:hypothetical protein
VVWEQGGKDAADDHDGLAHGSSTAAPSYIVQRMPDGALCIVGHTKAKRNSTAVYSDSSAFIDTGVVDTQTGTPGGIYEAVSHDGYAMEASDGFYWHGPTGACSTTCTQEGASSACPPALVYKLRPLQPGWSRSSSLARQPALSRGGSLSRQPGLSRSTTLGRQAALPRNPSLPRSGQHTTSRSLAPTYDAGVFTTAVARADAGATVSGTEQAGVFSHISTTRGRWSGRGTEEMDHRSPPRLAGDVEAPADSGAINESVGRCANPGLQLGPGAAGQEITISSLSQQPDESCVTQQCLDGVQPGAAAAAGPLPLGHKWAQAIAHGAPGPGLSTQAAHACHPADHRLRVQAQDACILPPRLLGHQISGFRNAAPPSLAGRPCPPDACNPTTPPGSALHTAAPGPGLPMSSSAVPICSTANAAGPKPLVPSDNAGTSSCTIAPQNVPRKASQLEQVTKFATAARDLARKVRTTQCA